MFFVREAKDYRYPGVVPLKIETHGGDDVGIFALGMYCYNICVRQA